MNRSTLTRRGFLAFSTLALGASRARASAPSEALYQARTIVTGRRDETRIPGLQRCLPQVLVRVSGDQRLAAHPLLSELTKAPEAAVKTSSFRDLYAFRPIRDEQGTRDRPYEMTVEYVPGKIDAILSRMGSKAWLADRPRLVVFLAVHHIGSQFLLSSMADAGELMRESFKDAAWNAALEVVIPSDATLARAALTVDSLPATEPSALLPFVDTSVGQLPLLGTLDWSKELLAWKARWRIAAGGKVHGWAIEGVNFDAAFRNGVLGAAQILSGNGEPA